MTETLSRDSSSELFSSSSLFFVSSFPPHSLSPQLTFIFDRFGLLRRQLCTGDHLDCIHLPVAFAGALVHRRELAGPEEFIGRGHALKRCNKPRKTFGVLQGKGHHTTVARVRLDAAWPPSRADQHTASLWEGCGAAHPSQSVCGRSLGMWCGSAVTKIAAARCAGTNRPLLMGA